jgi:hypothetical protein
MPRDTDLEAELRREAMDRLIAASTGGAASREATQASGASANSAAGRASGPNARIAG